MRNCKALHPAVQDFLAYLEVERDASPETLKGYRSDLNIFLEFLEEEMAVGADQIKLEQVTRRHLRRYLAYLRNTRKNSARTINRRLTALRSLYRFLVNSEDWLLEKSPLEGMPSLQYSKPLPTYLTLSEAEQLLTFIQRESNRPERDYALFLLFLQCGCRFSEIIGLTLDDVDLPKRTLRILGKGRKERIVPLTERTAAALAAYLRVRDPKVNTNSLFLNDRGRPLHPTTFRRIFDGIVTRSPLKGKRITPHKLRHTCLTLLMQAGVDIRTLQEIAGHSNVATTQIYTHVTQREVRKAMEKHPLADD